MKQEISEPNIVREFHIQNTHISIADNSCTQLAKEAESNLIQIEKIISNYFLHES